MKHLLISLSLLLLSCSAWAVKLSDYSPYKYDVLFTNPVCKTYYYETPVLSRDGRTTLTHKPKNVYCKKGDMEASGARESSPQNRLVKWIKDPSTKEIQFGYLSFSDRVVVEALCDAIERNVKVQFVLDSGTGTTAAKAVLACKPSLENVVGIANYPEVFYRGRENGIGYAHNKFFIVNPKSRDSVRIAFSSGNMSSGTVLHHENWHFITTSPKSYFAQVHNCLWEGMIKYDGSKKEFREYISSCRSRIQSPEEEDIKTYFVPGEGHIATEKIFETFKRSKRISIAAHRFSYSRLIDRLFSILKYSDIPVRLVADDDLFWIGNLHSFNGPNTRHEYGKVQQLKSVGLQVRYMETNHSSRLLHHNKFIVFDYHGSGGAVYTGAGNFTTTAYKKNFENYYFITIPEVYKKFKDQYEYMYNKLATPEEKLPRFDVRP